MEGLPEGFTMGGSMAGMKGMPSQEQAQVSKKKIIMCLDLVFIFITDDDVLSLN